MLTSGFATCHKYLHPLEFTIFGNLEIHERYISINFQGNYKYSKGFLFMWSKLWWIMKYKLMDCQSVLKLVMLVHSYRLLTVDIGILLHFDWKYWFNHGFAGIGASCNYDMKNRMKRRNHNNNVSTSILLKDDCLKFGFLLPIFGIAWVEKR